MGGTDPQSGCEFSLARLVNVMLNPFCGILVFFDVEIIFSLEVLTRRSFPPVRLLLRDKVSAKDNSDGSSVDLMRRKICRDEDFLFPKTF